jgi:hypothetical protein
LKQRPSRKCESALALMGKRGRRWKLSGRNDERGFGLARDRCSFLVHQLAEWHLKAWHTAPPAWNRQQLSPRGVEEKQLQQLQFQLSTIKRVTADHETGSNKQGAVRVPHFRA